MRVIIFGSDGYIGWPLLHHLNRRGHVVLGVDSGIKKRWERELNIRPLTCGNRYYGNLDTVHGDMCDAPGLYRIIDGFQPDAVVHLAEQPSAPFSMASRGAAQVTFENNTVGTLNLIFAIAHYARGFGKVPHIVKLGSMGEYGTPNIPIEEGWLEITHKGFQDRVLFPKEPGSMYHATKVCDSTLLEMMCRVWGLSVTDLNQGVVWGTETDECPWDSPNLRTSFHYDDVFGTVVNRFCSQAAIGEPLSVYGSGGQTRGFLHLRDSIQCIRLALEMPAAYGEFRVFNQFWETLSIRGIADAVDEVARVGIDFQENPRVEADAHLYRPVAERLPELGFVGTSLTQERLAEIVDQVALEPDLDSHRAYIAKPPRVRWRMW